MIIAQRRQACQLGAAGGHGQIILFDEAGPGDTAFADVRDVCWLRGDALQDIEALRAAISSDHDHHKLSVHSA